MVEYKVPPRLIASGGIALFASIALGQATYSQHDIVKAVLERHPAAALAQDRVDEAQARLDELLGLARLQPVFSGTASGSYGKVAEPPSIESYDTLEGSLTVPLPNRPLNQAKVEQGKAGVLSAKAGLQRARLDIAFLSSQAYYEYWRAQGAKAIAEQALDQAKRQVADTQKRVDAGDLPEADLLKAQVPVAEAQAALTRAEVGVSAAAQTLDNLLGKELDFPLKLAEPDTASQTEPDPKKLLESALKSSPEIVGAEAQVSAAKAGVRVAQHGNDPDFALQLTHVQTTDPTAYSHLTTLSVSIGLPLSGRSVLKSQVKQAQSQLSQANAALQLATEQVRLDVGQGFLDLRGAKATLEATTVTKDIASQSLAKARQAYAAGLTTTRDVLDAQFAYNQALVDENTARFDLAVAVARLRQITGEPTP